jgi:hypothetical protein
MGGRWTESISLDQFAYSVIYTMFERIFCKIQSSQVCWINLTISIPFGGNWRTFRLPISSVFGKLEDPGEKKLVIELISEQRPKNRYTLNIAGVPNSILIQKEKLSLIENSLTSIIRFPVFEFLGFESNNYVAIDFTLDTPTLTSIDELNNSVYQSFQEEFFKTPSSDESLLEETKLIVRENKKIELTKTILLVRFVRVINGIQRSRVKSDENVVKKRKIRKSMLPIKFQIASANVLEPLSKIENY